MNREPRLPALLRAIADAGALTSHAVAAATGMDQKVATKALANAKQLGYVQFVGERIPGELRSWALTSLGSQKAGALGLEVQHAPDGDSRKLAADAAALILAQQDGLCSDAIADQLGVYSFDVERAIALYESSRFVTCNVWRRGDEFIHYRQSCAPRRCTDWDKLAANVHAPAVLPRETNARFLGTTAVGLPVVEIDIDAIHRQQHTAATAEPAVEVQGTTESTDLDADHEQFFCLYSTGELLVQRCSGQQVQFTPDETRELFQWLDRLGGTALVRLAAPDDEVPA